MHKDITRVAVSVAAAAALSTLGVSGAGAPGAAAGVWQRAGHPAAGASKAAAVAGTQLWVKRYNGPGSGDDQAASIAVSPGGGKVFVTGTSTGTTTGNDYATVAYSAATGARLWVKRYNGPTSGDDQAASVAVSPDGTVFVTGTSNFEYLTLACNPATGARLWVKREPRGTNADRARAVAASPDGSKVFVTGTSFTEDDSDQLTVAYNAATGAELWAQDHGGTQIHSFDYANSMAVSPDGDIVFVAGNSQEETGEALITLAYNAFTGDQLWVQRWFTGSGFSVAVSPDSDAVYVTGSNDGAYATAGYDTTIGALLFARRYKASSTGAGQSVAVRPTGNTVFVTGYSTGAASGTDYATLAYNTFTGARLWARRYTGPGNGADQATSIAVRPTGNQVFVTGTSAGATSGSDYATIAYSG
jgi:WD40 repeat protein